MKKFITLITLLMLAAGVANAGPEKRGMKVLDATTIVTDPVRQVTPKKVAPVRLQAPINNRMSAKAKAGIRKAPKKVGIADLFSKQWMMCSELYEYNSEDGFVEASPAAGANVVTISKIDDTTIGIEGFTSDATEVIKGTINTEVDEELKSQGVIAEISIPDRQTLYESSYYGPIILCNRSYKEEGDPIMAYLYEDCIMINSIWAEIIGGEGEYAGYMLSGIYNDSMILPVNGTMTWIKGEDAKEAPVVIQQDSWNIRNVTIYNFASMGKVVVATLKGDCTFAIKRQLVIDNGSYGQYYTYAIDDDYVIYGTITGTGTADALTFDSGWTIYNPSRNSWYGLMGAATIAYTDGTQFEYPVIADGAATPANPEILEVHNYNAHDGYGSVDIDIPAAGAFGNDLWEDKLYYQLYSDIDGNIQPITFTTDLYTKLKEDMSIIPYSFTDYYDFQTDINDDESKSVYLKYNFNKMYNRIGVKSIYKGGGETRDSEIVWADVEKIIPEDLVVLPAGVEPEAWALEGYWNDKTSGEDVFRATEVAFDGNDVYVKGLSYYFEDAWLKGTLEISSSIVTFPSGQFVGEDKDGNEYMVGYDGNNICDIQYKYSSEAKTLTQVTLYVVESKTKSGLDEEGELASWGKWEASYFHTGEPFEQKKVVVPEGLETETYAFTASCLEADEEEWKAYTYQTQVGFDGNNVYFKGFSDNTAEMWAKGTLNEDGKTVTIPAGQFLGIFSSLWLKFDYYLAALDNASDVVDLVLNYNAELGTFSTSQTIMLNGSMFVYNPYQTFTNVTISKMEEFAATPAIPSIDGFKLEGTFPYVNFVIPAKDTEGNDIITSKLFYTVWVKENGEEKPFVVLAEEYSKITEDWTEIPYDWNDDYDIYKGGSRFYFNPGDAVANFTDIGIQSIYYGGGERRESNIVWMENPSYKPEKQEVYTEFVEETGTLTYYYDNKREERIGVTEVYKPTNALDPVRFDGYNEKVLKAVIDPSMKDAPLASFRNMFYGRYPNSLSNMTDIVGLENLNTINVTSMEGMFYSCSALTILDLSAFNTANLTNMDAMFDGCKNLTSIDISSFSTANVTNMSCMFNGCNHLTSLDLRSFNTANVTNLVAMFFGCRELTSLDLRSFNIANVTDMSNMFRGCSNLTTIYCDNDWSSSTTTSDYMFNNCNKLVGGEGTTFDSNVTDKTYARPDGGTSKPGYFTMKKAEIYTEFVEETGTLTYYYDNKREERTGVTELYDPINTPNAVRFNDYNHKIVKAVIDPSMKNAPLTSTNGMFYGGTNSETFSIKTLYKMTTIEGLENLNTANVTDMYSMFFSCSALTTLDLSSFNTSNVTNLNGMFLGCNNLEVVDVSSFDISNVTDMRLMFSGCSKLKTIYCYDDWSTSTAQSDNMFSVCNSLVGGQGTVFDSKIIDNTYARPDGGTETPGYFTIPDREDWNTFDTQALVYEWRTMDKLFFGEPQTDETGAYKVHVRSESQALAAGNMFADGTGHIAAWDTQFFITFGNKNALRLGDVLSISFMVKADVATQFTTFSLTEPGIFLHYSAIGNVDATTGWKEVSRQVTVDNNNYGLAEGTYTIAINLADGNENNVYFKDIVVQVKRAHAIDHWENIITNSDLLGTDMSCFYQKIYPATEVSQSTSTDGAIVINSPAKVEADWDSQFYIVLPQTLPAGTKFKVSFECKASTPTTITPQTHNAPGQYIHWDCFGDVPFSTVWSTYETTAFVSEECDGSVSSGGYKKDFNSICFNLTKKQDVTYYFKNIRVEIPVHSDKEESNELVELPAGVEAQKWMIEGTKSESTIPSNTRRFEYQTQVAFDGTDVYVRGLSYTFKDAWLKGKLDTETGLVTFPSGQYVGETEDYYAYMIGGDEHYNVCNIVLQYDAKENTLTQVTPHIINSTSWVSTDFIDSWAHFVISKFDTYTEYDESLQMLTYYYDAKRYIRDGVTEVYNPDNTNIARFVGYSDKVLKAVIDPSMKQAPLTSLRYMFYGGLNLNPYGFQYLTAMTTIEGLENLNTTNVTDMAEMFPQCKSLKTLDLSSFNTANVTNMNSMFMGCSNLEIVDVSSFDISNVTEMSYMFYLCPKLTTICCSNDWSTSSAHADNMFMECTSLVGGAGTLFDATVLDKTYARPDGGTEAPGYFTADTMTGISLTPALSKGEGAIYNLSGQRVNKPVQKGLYIINGKKMMVK